MSVTVVCDCSRRFELKDEFAGQMVQCPSCGAVARAGDTAVAVAEADPIFGRDLFLLRQKVAINEKYFVSDEQGGTLLYVVRPAHFFRSLLAAFGALGAWMVSAIVLSLLLPIPENAVGDVVALLVMGLSFVAGGAAWMALSTMRHVSFHAGVDETAPKVLSVLQDKKVQFPTRTFTILDEEGRLLGTLAKNAFTNILRKQWQVFGPGGRPICLVREDSIVLSLLRRFLGPLFGFLRTNFLFLQFGNERDLGEFRRKMTILDKYVLDLSDDRTRFLDRRLAVAAAVMLDTGERR